MWFPAGRGDNFVDRRAAFGPEHRDQRVLLCAGPALNRRGQGFCRKFVDGTVHRPERPVAQWCCAQGDRSTVLVMAPDGVEIGGDDFLDEPVFKEALAEMDSAALEVAVTGKIAPSSRAQAVDGMAVWASDNWMGIMLGLRIRATRNAAPSTGHGPPTGGGPGEARSLGVFAFAEGAVSDAFQQACVMLEGADMAPIDLVGVGVEMVVAERLQATEHLVDLRFLADEGAECGSFDQFLEPVAEPVSLRRPSRCAAVGGAL